VVFTAATYDPSDSLIRTFGEGIHDEKTQLSGTLRLLLLNAASAWAQVDRATLSAS
jgi:hypothetical protein